MEEGDITEFLPNYPEIGDSRFNDIIYRKNEFWEERLEAKEAIPTEAGVLMKHQRMITRFLSPVTPYNELLLYHQMGVGKTCAAVGVAENLKSTFRGVLYIARGENLLDNFRNELLFRCTGGQYIPQGWSNLTDREKKSRSKKMISDYYKTWTMQKFAKYIKNTGIPLLRKRFRKYLIIVDEVHNLRIQPPSSSTGGDSVNIYNNFKKFLQALRTEECKILLLSGTPMQDDVSEIASLMNLILPPLLQLPTGKKFRMEYVENTSKWEKLREIFQGRISYLKSPYSLVPKVFEGVVLEGFEKLRVVPDEMSEFQSRHYLRALEMDIREGSDQLEK